MVVIREESEMKEWRLVFQRIISVILFLGERGLAFQGSSQRIGDPHNGNFLGMIELLAQFDLVIASHVKKVKDSQAAGTRMQAHYLSWDSQNQFASSCAKLVTDKMLKELKGAVYFSHISDSTPDNSHKEQTTILLRYLLKDASSRKYTIKERFLTFVDCSE